jgi:hypothetical protein
MKKFFTRKYIAFVVFLTTILTKTLNRFLGHLIRLNVLDQSLIKIRLPAPPHPSPPPPQIGPSKDRPQLQIPYVPEWVADSFKNPSKHPVVKARGPLKPASDVSWPVVITVPEQVTGAPTISCISISNNTPVPPPVESPSKDTPLEAQCHTEQ